MHSISVNDLVNQLAHLQFAGSLAIIGVNAEKIVAILSKKWGFVTAIYQ